MENSKIKDENYYQIQGWMINRLKLKGVSLSVYAIIYGFSQDGENEYTGSLQYLCDFCGGVSKPTIINALKALVESEYLIRREEFINGVKFTRYKANLPLVKNLYYSDKEILTGVVKKFNGGSKEILPNNKIDNNSINKNNNVIGESPKRKRFEPPTLEEVKAYCSERRNNVNAERFIDYYTSNGWQVGRNKMKDWKAAVRTWERNGYGNNKTYGANGIAIDLNAPDDLDGIL